MIQVAEHQKEALIRALENSDGAVTIDVAGPDLDNGVGKWLTVDVPEDECTYAVSPGGMLSTD